MPVFNLCLLAEARPSTAPARASTQLPAWPSLASATPWMTTPLSYRSARPLTCPQPALCLAPPRTRERRSAPPQNTAPTAVPLPVAVTLSSAQAPRTPTPNHSSPDDPKTTLRFFFPVHGRRMQLPDSPSSTRPRARFDAPCNLREPLCRTPLSSCSSGLSSRHFLQLKTSPPPAMVPPRLLTP